MRLRDPNRKKTAAASRRARAAIVAIALALVGALGLVAFVKGAEQRALAGEKLADVLVVRSRVNAGTRAEDLADRVRTEQVPAKVEADGAVADLSALQGKVASVDLLPGEQVTAGRFISQDEFVRTKGKVSVPKGLLEVTVSLEPERAVGGVLQPGGTVGVVASFDGTTGASRTPNATDGVVPPTDTGGEATHMILQKVLVTNVQSAHSFDYQVGPSNKNNQNSETAPAPSENLLVTLALDAPSVERMVFAAEHGSIWLAYEPKDAPEDGTRVLTGRAVFQ